MGRPKSGKTAPKGKSTVLDRFTAGQSTIKEPEIKLPIGESVRPSGLVVIHREPTRQFKPEKNNEATPAAEAVAPKKRTSSKTPRVMPKEVREWQARRPAGGGRQDYINWAAEKPSYNKEEPTES